MSAELDMPYDQVLMWAFNFACDTIEPLDAEFPQLGIRKNEPLFGDIYQSAVIVAALLRIERFLGKHDYSRLHAGIIQNVDPSVRSRYLAAIQRLCCFLLQRPLRTSESEAIPSLDSLHDKTPEDLEALIGLWVAWSLIGSKPKLDHELHFTSAVGKLVYSNNAQFIASRFLSNGKQWAGEDKELMALLRDATTPKTELARAYVAATSTQQLLTLAVEPLCLAAADIFFVLNSPGPLNIVAALQRRLTPNRYWAEFARTNALFAECLLCVLKKFEEFCRHAGVDISADQFNTLAVEAAYYWQSRNRYPESEEKAFRDQVIKILASHGKYPSEGSDRLRRIMDAAGKRPSDQDLVKLIMMTQDPSMRLEPVFFVERFKQLTDKQ